MQISRKYVKIFFMDDDVNCCCCDCCCLNCCCKLHFGSQCTIFIITKIILIEFKLNLYTIIMTKSLKLSTDIMIQSIQKFLFCLKSKVYTTLMAIFNSRYCKFLLQTEV